MNETEIDCGEIRDKLDAHLLGALDDAESKRIEEHLRTCPHCRDYLGVAIQAMETMRSLPGVQAQGGYAERILSAPRSSRKYILTLTLGIILLLFLTLSLMVSISQYRRVYPKYHLATLATGIHRYHLEHQAFPPDVRLLAELLLSGKAGGPYISSKMFAGGQDGSIVDTWGTPYVYTCPGIHNRSSFDLYSCGPNTTDERGRGDDFPNWGKP